MRSLRQSLSSLLCVLGVTLSGSAFGFGALAIDHNHGEAYGASYNHETQRRADRAALDECGHGCTVVVRYNTGCAAYAADQTRGSTVYGWAPGHTEIQAKRKAMRNCANYGGQNCLIRVWSCEG